MYVKFLTGFDKIENRSKIKLWLKKDLNLLSHRAR